MFTSFNGQHRKVRTVNMAGGNRNGPGRLDSLVKKANLERERREKNRILDEQQARADQLRREQEAKELASAIKIQKFFRRWRTHRRYFEELEEEWEDNLTTNDEDDYDDEDEFKVFLVEFCYFFGRRYNGSEKNLDSLQRFSSIFRQQRQQLEGLDSVWSSVLVSTLSSVFSYKIEGETARKCQAIVLDLLVLFDSSVLPKSLLTVLSEFLEKTTQVDTTIIPHIQQLIASLSLKYPEEYYTKFLSTPTLLGLSENLLQIPHSTAQSIVAIALSKPPSSFIKDISCRLWHLANFVTATIPHFKNVTYDYLRAINVIIRDLNVSISSSKPKGSKPDPQIYYVTDKELLSAISLLYSRNFVNSMLEHMSTTLDVSFEVLASIFVSLEGLYPSKRQNLYISMTTTESSKSFPLVLWEFFERSQLYSLIGNKILSVNSILELSKTQTESMTQLLLIFELLVYWLAFTFDAEFHNIVSSRSSTYKKIVNLSKFLKYFCFSLIRNWPFSQTSSSSLNQPLNSIDPIIMAKMNKLKNNGILLMRQFYLRDSRRQFLETDFWLMTQQFDMNNFVNEVVSEEKKRLEAKKIHEDEASDSDSDSEAEDDGFDLTKSKRSAMLEKLGYRLYMLKQTPFFIPFNVRVRIFQELVALDRSLNQVASEFSFNVFGVPTKHHANIRRSNLLEDAFEGFDKLSEGFKSKIAVTFFNEYGPEMGIDGGGIMKEFLTSICSEAFQPTEDNEYDAANTKKGLFSVNKDHLLYPNPIFGVNSKYSALTPEEKKEGLRYIKFLGKIIGKCLYEGILVDVEFSLFFLQKLSGIIDNSFDDMYSLDPEVYNSLIKLYNYPGDVEELSLDFTISQKVGHGKYVTIPLVPDGQSIAVTNNNRLRYIHAVSQYKLNTVLTPQTRSFLSGMSTLISLDWFSMFNGPELQMLISGGSSRINISDLKAHTLIYDFPANDTTISDLWDILENDFTEEERRLFIKFVTSVPKAPLLGFGALVPNFAIRRASNDQNRLPTASTCVNLLKLPHYTSRAVLKKKLLDSIHAEAGFDLS
ncbi:similar to Saccharomyces cerevisiae YGL141W HUL5 Multiubiquitin chain assembly factor (E4) [Geotrichum candidum]|uniref:HECT-type E3 ubiquitin transferase n=1 Tax=Geotrichum candidum TaxID=1173061 RepID=A0A0J9X6J0_GEOCN|nr:similar to Saccharomyces cerevisiae YGL141W HUL5 Multiubiquitin chain assembly factor (E4) [Geotrichum candidum]